MIGPLHCAHCGALIDLPYTSRRFCPARSVTSLPRALVGLMPPMKDALLDDQIVRAILAARGLVGAVRRLGVEAYTLEFGVFRHLSSVTSFEAAAQQVVGAGTPRLYEEYSELREQYPHFNPEAFGCRVADQTVCNPPEYWGVV